MCPVNALSTSSPVRDEANNNLWSKVFPAERVLAMIRGFGRLHVEGWVQFGPSPHKDNCSVRRTTEGQEAQSLSEQRLKEFSLICFTKLPKNAMPALRHSGDEWRKLGKEEKRLSQRTVQAQAQDSKLILNKRRLKIRFLNAGGKRFYSNSCRFMGKKLNCLQEGMCLIYGNGH